MPDSVDATAQIRISPHVRFIDDFLRRLPDGRCVGLLVLQLDKFNRIGTSFGRQKADSLCMRFAEQLRGLLPERSPVIRLQERHFAVMIVGKSTGAIFQAANAVMKEIEPRIVVDGQSFNVTSNMGVAFYPEHATDGPSLLRRAELALSHAKESDVSIYLYQPDATMQQRTLWRFETDLQQAVQDKKLEVHYQPKFSLSALRVTGAEALVRWRKPSGELMPAGEFIPTAERSGALIPLTWLVFDEVAKASALLKDARKPFSVAINVPPQALLVPEFLPRVQGLHATLQQNQLDLILELTEESLVQGNDESLALLNELREYGIGLAIDDFGQGFSSLNYLKRIPATEIKIDKQFVSSMALDERDEHIVKTTIDLAHTFEMDVVAEGVDNAESLQLLRDLECECVQGYFIARPMSGEAFADWLGADSFGAVTRALARPSPGAMQGKLA